MATTRAPVTLRGQHSSIALTQPAPGVVLVTICGRDTGEHGDEPFRELAKDVERGPFHLFIDARATSGATLEVSNVWAGWLRSHRDRLHKIHMLTGSKFIQVTADFVRRFAELGDAMLIYTDTSAFDDALAQACPNEGARPGGGH